MESTVESLERVYNDLISAVAAAMQAHEPAPEETKAIADHASQQHHHPSSNQNQHNQNQSQTTTTEREAALERLKQSWELFKVACDRAEELLDSLRQRIGSECLVDEATGASAASSSASASASAVNSGPYAHHVVGIPPISAVKLERMSKAVRWLVIDLQQGHAQAQAHAHAHAQAQVHAHAHAQALAHAPAEDAAQP